MEQLSWWLMFVAILRSISVILGYVAPTRIQQQLFSTAALQATPLTARTFSVWTFLSGSLALICAYHLHERGIYIATLLSFILAAIYFTLELIVFQTVKLKDWSVAMSFAIASQ